MEQSISKRQYNIVEWRIKNVSIHQAFHQSFRKCKNKLFERFDSQSKTPTIYTTHRRIKVMKKKMRG